MSVFQPKPSIHLQIDQEEANTSQRPSIFSRKSSSWSIPCCSYIVLGKSRGLIQLPDDSDNDSIEEDYSQPTPPPFIEDSNSDHLPNVFLQAQARSQTSLSRNPFARVSSSAEEHSRTSIEQTSPFASRTIESFMPEASGEEELANFPRSSFTRYNDEPDWTETFKDEESSESIAIGFQIKNDQEYADNTKAALSKDALHTWTDSTSGSDNIPSVHEDNSSSIIAAQTKEDRVPQIEEEVLHLLPLPELSNEIPPAMIHKKASFEKSMYGEEPLVPVQKGQQSQSRVSRFSMTEAEYLALKKAEEKEKRASLMNIANTSIPIIIASDRVQSPQDSSLDTNGSIHPEKQEIQAKPVPVAKDERRASIAQSILGDKLDDFTEKLAFIKKNIIMNMDSDEEDEEEISADKILKKMEEAKANNSASNTATTTTDQRPTLTLHRRTSSLMDAVPTIARLMNQIGGGSGASPETSSSSSSSSSSNAQLSSSQTSTSSSFSPSSLFSALAGPMPEPSSSLTTNKKQPQQEKFIQEENEEEQDEELFDFNKVLEIGKNVKTFGEGFVGNGIRMFNDVATRVKTTVEEEQKRAAHIAAQINESTSTASSSNNNDENEWMHNYL